MATETIPTMLIPNMEGDHSAEMQLSIDVSTSQASHHGSEIDIGTKTDTASSTDFSSTVSDLESSASLVKLSRPTVQKTFRLSFSQEMFWFVHNFLKDKTSLNHTAWARLSGNMRMLDLQSAIRSLAQRHEALRTCIFEEDGKPVQGVLEASALHLEIGHIKEEEEVHQAVMLLQNDHIFDVARGKTVRIMLLSRSPIEHFFVAALHLLIADGVSFQNLLNGIQELYTHPNSYFYSKTLKLSDFSEKQHSQFAAGEFEHDLDFWRNEFVTLPPPLPILTLSTVASRPALTAYENERAVLSVTAESKERIQSICRQYKTSPFHFYLAVFRVLL